MYYGNGMRCVDPCDTYFKICVKRYESSRTTKEPCRFGKKTTEVLGGNSFKIPLTNGSNTKSNATTTNQVTLPFTFSWMVS